MRIIFGAVLCALGLVGCGEPVTRGEVRDRQIAQDTDRCANQYLGHANSGPNTEIWIMCVQVSASLEKRDPVGVAKQVIRQKGWNVFEFSDRSGANNELSAAGIARISSGE